MFDHTGLRVWQRSHALAIALHNNLKSKLSTGAPGFSSQLQRAAASIPANIAEGAAQQTSPQCARFLNIAIGSAGEVENHLAFAEATALLPAHIAEQHTQEVREIRRMLVGLRKWVLRTSATQ